MNGYPQRREALGKNPCLRQWHCANLAAYGTADCDRGIANALFENFVDPRRITSAFLDVHAARRLIAGLSGHSWRREFLGGALRVGPGQRRRVFGQARLM